MKKYEPEALTTVSRYRKYFPTLPKDVQRAVYARMRELLEEEKTYCDKGNYAHMAQMLSSYSQLFLRFALPNDPIDHILQILPVRWEIVAAIG